MLHQAKRRGIDGGSRRLVQQRLIDVLRSLLNLVSAVFPKGGFLQDEFLLEDFYEPNALHDLEVFWSTAAHSR